MIGAALITAQLCRKSSFPRCRLTPNSAEETPPFIAEGHNIRDAPGPDFSGFVFCPDTYPLREWATLRSGVFLSPATVVQLNLQGRITTSLRHQDVFQDILSPFLRAPHKDEASYPKECFERLEEIHPYALLALRIHLFHIFAACFHRTVKCGVTLFDPRRTFYLDQTFLKIVSAPPLLSTPSSVAP
jgi:hypothetical protein